MNRKLILVLAIIAWLAPASAQQRESYNISGIIQDAQTLEPSQRTTIELADRRSGFISDSLGRFQISNLAPGHYTLEFSQEGYRIEIRHIDLARDTSITILMQPAIIVNEGVTITGVAAATSTRKAPFSIERVSREELLAHPANNIIDAISRQPGVNQISTGPAVSKPVIRGLGYNRLIVINDAIRQEGQQWGDEHGIEIDQQSVTRVEILKGPAALIYGSDAIAGVVNIVTTTPVPDGTTSGSVMAGYGTNNRERSFNGQVAGNHNGFNWKAWGSYRAAGDYQNKYDGLVWNSKFKEMNGGGYLGINKSWGYSHLIVSSFNQQLGLVEGERFANGQFIKENVDGSEAVPTNADHRSIHPSVPYQDIHHLKFTLDNSFRIGNNRLTATVAWQNNKRIEHGNVEEPVEKSLFFDLSSYNYNLAWHLPEWKDWESTIGLNGMYQQNTNRGIEYLIPDYKLFDLGSYIFLRKSWNHSTFSGGVRYDRRSLNSESLIEAGDQKFAALKKNFSNFSGSAGLSYEASDKWTLKFNLAQGFRAPTIPELSSNGAHEGTLRYEYGNDNLKSEVSYQGDLGAEYRSEHVLLTASMFYNRINHFIFYNKLQAADGSDSMTLTDDGPLRTFRFNQNDAQLYGLETMIDLHPHPLDWLHWQTGFSWVRGSFLDPVEGVNNLPLIPAARLFSEFRTEFLNNGSKLRGLEFNLEADYNFDQNRAFTAFDTETPTPAYLLINAGVQASVMKGDRKLFTVYLNGTNLTDKAYQPHLSRLKYTAANEATGRTGVFSMGRNFSLRLLVPLGG